MDHDDHLSPTPSARGGGGSGIRWEPHGRVLTACLVALNVFLVVLVYVYFWRFFSRSRGGGDAEAASSPPASPKARDRREVERAITSLPVFVAHSSSGGSAAAECAICIAELADGEEGRLLPRCGHRFHARCVDAWFRFHTTCPLCRASVLASDDNAPLPAAPAEPATTTTSQPSRHTDSTDRPSTDADSDSPV
ncbi:RING-H2 finger protein ATL39-like [Panicum miliaceum]|uniref:RING-type E3 ubiquitin transferase n=1 Tax=Panicum miliaceum TaxID=4540 RepID=A0A3L6SX01_PANMI|nr:RING-H2 finger protein ATL39-like [Panicum miliaceum]